MAQLPPGFPRISPPPLRWSFRPPPPPPPSKSSSPSSQGRIVAGIFIGMVTSLLLFTIVCSLCRVHRNSRARAATAAAAARPRPLPERRVRDDERQLRCARTASPTAGLPAFMYSLSVKHNVTGEGEEAATCSVCLGALQVGETVRLLPVCLHLYHVECIDPWLDAHSTCPLCRSDTDPSSRLPPV